MSARAGRWDMPRRSALLIVLAAAACRSGPDEREASESFEPLTYEYLTPIRLNVATVDVGPLPTSSGAAEDMTALDPVRPADAMAQMAHDRLQALGTSGRAVLTIEDATILRRDDVLEGSFAVELDIYTSANDRAAFAEARVSGRRPVGEGESTREALYALTRELMAQLNVEVEFQVRRSLRDWLVEAPAAEPSPVQELPLPLPTR